MIVILAALLCLTLFKTNPSVEDFALYYEKGEWTGEKGLLDGHDKVIETLRGMCNGYIVSDMFLFTLYDFGDTLFIAIAGDFYMLES